MLHKDRLVKTYSRYSVFEPEKITVIR